jgi:hypothetical protein
MPDGSDNARKVIVSDEHAAVRAVSFGEGIDPKEMRPLAGSAAMVRTHSMPRGTSIERRRRFRRREHRRADPARTACADLVAAALACGSQLFGNFGATRMSPRARLLRRCSFERSA